MHAVSLNWLDLIIIGAYFLVIVLTGLQLRGDTNTSAQFFHAGRSLPAIVTGIAFVAANCGALEVMGIVVGLGFVLGCGYWCTDFLLIQRALAARDLKASVETPLIGAVTKLFFPLLVVLPGLAAVALLPPSLAARYDLALPALLAHYYGHGLLGLGVTAMLASFMSGMAGNITAFNTVWTHDLYRAHLVKNKPDRHCVRVGRITTIVATILSIATAYIVLSFTSLMDYVQLLFSFFNALLFATFLLGMFTTWATPAAGFWGLLAGVLAALLHNILYRLHWIHYGSDMSANFYGAIAGWSVCFLTKCVISLCTAKKPAEELQGVVFERHPSEGESMPRLMRPPWIMATTIAVICILLNWIFR
jgi:solute:Na+ symporter, SSS family